MCYDRVSSSVAAKTGCGCYFQQRPCVSGVALPVEDNNTVNKLAEFNIKLNLAKEYIIISGKHMLYSTD